MFRLILLLTILLGYFEHYSAYYVKMFQGDKIQILGTLKEFRYPCDERTERSVCTNKYIVPGSLIKNQSYIGTGIIISASRYYCKGNKEHSVEFDNPHNPGKIFDLVNTYQVVNLASLNCTDDLIVESWSYPHFRRSGHQGGSLVVGDYEGVNRVKKITELVTRDMYRLIFLGFIIVWLLFRYLRNNNLVSVEEQIFYPFIVYWVLYIGAATDIFEALVPYTELPNIMQKTVAFFGLGAHFLPISIYALRKHFPLLENRMIIILNVLFFLVVINNFWKSYYFLFLLSILLYLLLGIKEKRGELLLFGVITMGTILKVIGVDGMPSGRTSTIFLAAYLTYFTYSKIRQVVSENTRLSYREKVLNHELKSEKILANYEKQAALFNQAKLVAHDLRAPLTVLQEVILSERKYSGGVVEASMSRMWRVIDDLLGKKDMKQYSREVMDVLGTVVRGKELVSGCNIKCHMTLEEDIKIKGEYLALFERAISNVLQNAVDEAPNVNIYASMITSENRDCRGMQVRIENEAPELSIEKIEKLNQGIPFTSKEKGNGLGASSSFTAIKKIGGKVVYEKIDETLLVTAMHFPRKIFIE